MGICLQTYDTPRECSQFPFPRKMMKCEAKSPHLRNRSTKVIPRKEVPEVVDSVLRLTGLMAVTLVILSFLLTP